MFTPSETTAAILDFQTTYQIQGTHNGTIMDTMDVIKTGKNGKHLNTLEKYHICRICRKLTNE
jgi:hypothetical protein